MCINKRKQERRKKPAAMQVMLPNEIAFAKDGRGNYFCLWKTVDQFARNYPESHPTAEQRANAIAFFTSFTDAIPCPDPCRVHYREWLSRYPIENYLDSRIQLRHYVHDMHNEVNRRTGKRILSFEEADAIQDFNGNLDLTGISNEIWKAKHVPPNNCGCQKRKSPSKGSWWPAGLLLFIFVGGGLLLFCFWKDPQKRETFRSERRCRKRTAAARRYWERRTNFEPEPPSPSDT
jgi:hypothetical protein